ncbi:hypothetical protein SAMN04487910_0542 [Aquimarina amphilecti]|uniref:NlpE N-terminal domain-containing protein n=1 Tax=Aquimarina amphilecti TaxID=1038014 RepID=A0A1H7H1Y7_AQUAM|nr:hypothetical protein [Aquimarina amphilecti]SEK44433.1 hypothetical protein SAMN04487910_0542 [Aquimarina amphilecti]
MKNVLVYVFFIVISTSSCKANDTNTTNTDLEISNAEVTSVSVAGEQNSYTFSVQIKSPDLGCNQYADWWEIVSEDGTLLYRRILAHSHVNEQPFTRSGGLVNITKDQIVYVRAHMNTVGYGELVFKGNVSDGFSQEILETTFANQLESEEPLPSDCAF